MKIIRKIATTTLLVILATSIVTFGVKIKKNIRDLYREYSYAMVKSQVYEIINVTTDRIVVDEGNFGELVEITKEDNGKVSLIKPNVNAVNVLSNLVAVECQNDLSEYTQTSITIPFGAFSGSPLLADKGRDVTIPLKVEYTVRSDFKEYLEHIGINVVRYAIYLQVTTTGIITLPQNEYEAVFDTYILVTENVFSTDIPDTYISSKDDLQYLDLLP